MTDRRRRTVAGVLAILWCAAAAALAHPAAAQTVDPYLVEGVDVDAEAESAAKAREKALVEGERLALERLLKRLTLTADHGRLPQVDPQRRTALVEDFRVRSEKTSAVRYIADLSYRFKREGIRALLTGAGVTFVETPSKPVVVVPVYRSGAGAVLWDGLNPWRSAWDGIELSGGLVPFVIPAGDLPDLQAIDAAQAIAGDAGALKAIAARYNANVVLVAVADEGTGGGSVVSVSGYNTATGTAALQQRFPIASGERSVAMGASAEQIVSAYEERWKRDNIVAPGGVGNAVQVVVPIASYGDWVEIRRRLRSVAIVRQINVLQLTRESARLELEYTGDVDQLRVALAQSDLRLASADAVAGAADGSPVLSLAEGSGKGADEGGAGEPPPSETPAGGPDRAP